MRKVISFAGSLLLVCQFAAADLPRSKPEKVGFSSERLQQISKFTQRHVDEEKHAGFVTMVARRGKIVHFEAAGRYGMDNDKPMEQDTIFRIFSMTKPITSVAMMMLYEEGAFQMNEPVSNFLPALKNLKVYHESGNYEDAAPITIEHLFTHTAGMSYGFRPADPVDQLYRGNHPLSGKNLDEFIERLSQLPLRFQPGTRYHYSVATDVLGAIVEKISGQPLDEFYRQRIFEPLGMTDTYFNLPADKLERLATNHAWDRENNRMSLELPPNQRRPVTGVTLFSGGGGLVSTAMDYMIFSEMLRRGGSYNGARILGPKTIQYMTMDHLKPDVLARGAGEFPESHLYPGHSFGLGFSVINNPGIASVVSSKGAYSWGGAADTKFWIDPEEDMVVILMTQLMGSPWDTRYRIKSATYQALTELGDD